ncbi:MAG TPA: DapH/DapD/GlmU-related protein [Solirubrobacteraceae bacterium]|nr:DapH/DapD/GlmU-related protein [Solirubrobacteraceae bacterium]
MTHDRLQGLKRMVRRLWVMSPERLWLASIALNGRGHWVMAFWLKQLGGFIYHNSLAPGASVSADIFLGHNGLGIVVNRNVEIGERVTIWQHVTLAAGRPERRRWRDERDGGQARRAGQANGKPSSERARIVIEDDVKIGANAVVIAPRGTTLRIGQGARVGAGTVVTEDVPAGAIVVGARPRVLLGAGAAVAGDRQATDRRDTTAATEGERAAALDEQAAAAHEEERP